MDSIDKLEKTIDKLNAIGLLNGKNSTIKVATYNAVISDPNKELVLEEIIGKKPKEWKKFKDDFIKIQEAIGIYWSSGTGYGGPLSISKIEITREIGIDLAKRIMENNIKEGIFTDYLQEYMPKAFSLMSKYNFDYNFAREGFKEYKADNKNFKFSAGNNSQRFNLTIAVYEYRKEKNKKSSKPEKQLGEKLHEDNRFKSLFNLAHLEDSQGTLSSGKYQNIDLEGFKIVYHDNNDGILYYAFVSVQTPPVVYFP